MEWYYVCWPWLTAKRVEPVVSISWASCSSWFVALWCRHILRLRGAQFEQVLRRGLFFDFDAVSSLFRKGSLFQMHYIVPISAARWPHNFREIAVQNFKNSKNQQTTLSAPFRIQQQFRDENIDMHLYEKRFSAHCYIALAASVKLRTVTGSPKMAQNEHLLPVWLCTYVCSWVVLKNSTAV